MKAILRVLVLSTFPISAFAIAPFFYWHQDGKCYFHEPTPNGVIVRPAKLSECRALRGSRYRLWERGCFEFTPEGWSVGEADPKMCKDQQTK